MSRGRSIIGGAALLAGAALVLFNAVDAQENAGPVVASADPAAAPAAGAPDPILVFEREVFDYGAIGLRDPFRPLAEGEAAGPIFEDLTLRMIIFVDIPSQSVAVLSDARGKIHRVRRGDIIGNAQVQDIAKSHVVFSVENLGVRRQQVLELKKPTEGA